MTDRRNMSPAGELGHLRDETRRLKTRETELRQETLETGEATGTDYTVEIKAQERRSVDRPRLPQDIQDDPAYWKVSTTNVVKTVPVVVGGIIPDEDAEALLAKGVARVYTPKDFELNWIMEDIVGLVGETVPEAA